MSKMARSSKRRPRKNPEEIARSRRNHLVLLGLLTLLVFASSLGGDFVWSDREDILDGAYRIGSLDELGAALTQSRDAYRARDVGGLADTASGSWQPLTALSNTLSWSLWRDCAVCFHLENMLLHLLTVIGFYALCRHLMSQRRHGPRIAFWSAALFAVHPAVVHTVAWIGGRPYLLAGAFGIWALVAFSRLQATTKSRHGHVNRWLIALPVLTLFAMLAHETAYLLPFAALLVAGFESGERGRGALAGIAPIRRLALLQLFATLGLVLLYRHSVLGGIAFSGDYPTDSFFSNLGMALRHFWYLTEQMVWPSEPIVSDAWPLTRGWTMTEVAALLGFLLLLTLTVVGLRLRHPSAFGVAWFMLWLLPGIGVFPSDHYHNGQTLYLASWGIAFAVGYALFALWRPLGRQLVPGSEVVVYLPFLLTLGLITAFSNARWWDHVGLFESEIAHDPHYMEGRIELAKSALERNDAEVAMNHALAAIEASRDKNFTGYWSQRDAYLVLGRAQLEIGLLHEAAGSLAHALSARPGDAQILYWLGVAQIETKDYAAAESNLRLALQVAPDMAEANADLGTALAAQARYVDAYPLLAEAIEHGLGNARRHQAMARTMIDAGRLEDAAHHLEKALATREEAETRARLAWLNWQLGHKDKAHADLNMAMQLEEESSEYVTWVRQQIDEASAAETADKTVD